MDALSALSVAASVIQFVSFTSDVVKMIYDASHATSGQLPQHARIKQETAKLLELSNGIQQVLQPNALGRPQTVIEETLNSVCADCQAKATALMDALAELEVKPPMLEGEGKQGRRKGKSGQGKTPLHWRHVQQVIKSIWQQRDVESLQERLGESKEMLMMTIIGSLREQASVSNHSVFNIAKPPEKDSFSAVEWFNLTEAIEKMHIDVLRSIDSKQGGREQIQLEIRPWAASGLGVVLVDAFLKHLHFPEISDRQERIPLAHAKTFQWIFNPPENSDKAWDSFAEWLESSSNLYWITGKPGSGKSTLMKFVFNEGKTKQHLMKWTKDSEAVVAAFFFWNSGFAMQMNQLGLLQSLLFQVLSQRSARTPRPIPEGLYHLCLSKDYTRPWVWTELVQSLRILIKDDPELHFFFLIDGLDEFSGEKSELIELIGTLAVHPNVKVCVSSRPWPVFEDAYETQPSLVMENITYTDIKLYITAKFETNPAFVDMKEVHREYCNKLIEDMILKACGVFLWVVLTVKSLLEGFSNGDRIRDIRERLTTTPPDLEGLFRKILDSLEPRYFEHASQLFRVYAAAQKPLTLLCMAFADLEVKDAREEEVKPLSKSKIRYLARTMRRRLNSRCKGLLEVGLLDDEQGETEFWNDNLTTSDPSSEEVENEPEEEDDDWTSDDGRGSADNVDGVTPEEMDILATKKIQYLHRTVKDFLEQPEIWDRIVAGAGAKFHPHTALYASYLLQLKSLDPETMTREKFWDTLTWTIEYAASTENNISKSEYIEYIDEIDRVGHQLCNKELSSGGTFTDAESIKFMLNRKTNRLDLDDEDTDLPSEHSVSRWLDAHWTTTVPSKRRQRNTTFLSVAVWCGLTSYLAVKLARKDSEVPTHPLLFSAVMDYDLFHRMKYFDRPHCAQASPNYDVVRLLLENGANPDVTSPSSAPQPPHLARDKSVTPWKIVWKRHLYEKTGSWARIYELFVSHGAGDLSQDGVVKKKERKAQQKHIGPKAEKWTNKFNRNMLKNLRKET